MLLNSLALSVAALAGSAQAGWAIVYPASLSTTNAAQASSIQAAYISKYSEYQATLTTGSQYLNAQSVFVEWAQTRTDVPPVATATDRATLFTTTPAWFNAMPTEVKNFFEQNKEKNDQILKELGDSLKNGGEASRPAALSLYMSGALVAMVAGVAMAL